MSGTCREPFRCGCRDVKKVRDTCCRSLRIAGLLQSLEFALALHDVLVIPLDLDRLLEPPLEIPGRDLIVRSIPGFGGLETAFGLKTRLVEGLAAPEQEADAVFELVVADDRVAVQEPHRVPVPDLALRIGQVLIDGPGEGVSDAPVAGRLGGAGGASGGLGGHCWFIRTKIHRRAGIHQKRG